MKILHLSAVKTWGGGENHIFNLVKTLNSTYPENKNFVLCPNNSALYQKLKENDLSVSTSKLSLKIDPRYSLKIIAICRKEKIDLIHIHDPTALTLSIIADKLYRLPPFVLSKKTSFPIKDRRQTLYKYNYPKIKRILCVSIETRRITSKAIVEEDKLETIYHGTNVSANPYPSSIILREQLNLKKDQILIGNIANHIRAKDLDTFINVIDQLVNVHNKKELHFIQIGAFSKRTDALIHRVRLLHLEDHITFMGFQPNASQLISQFNISVLTSQSEGVPQFIYESFLMKIPVVSTNVGGISEIIEHGVNGLLAPAHDHIKIANLLITLIDNVSLQENFIHRSHNVLIRSFSTETMAQKTMTTYKSIVNGK